MSENDIKKDILLLSTEFIDGFTQSNDKMAYLKLSDFPNEIELKRRSNAQTCKYKD